MSQLCADMKKYLEQEHGFTNPVLIMDDGKHTSPTRKNILDAFQRVAEQSKSGDVVFIRYSGHGGRLKDQHARNLSGFTQVLPHQRRGGGDEDDGYGETLIPLDFQKAGQIRDDDLLRVLVNPMAADVTLTCLMDSCHSGTVLDLPYKFTAKDSKMCRNDKFRMARFRRTPSSCPSLLNVMNVLAYLANFAVTYGLGVLGLFGTPTNSELSERYQTLVTPVGSAFCIWADIFTAQLIWAIAQLVPSVRDAPLVRNGVRWYYLGVCRAQIGWTVSFSFEIIWLSLVEMLSILFFLARIVVSQYYAQTTVSIRGYFLLKFPLSIHTGWTIAASLVNINALLVDLELNADIQYYAALASLGAVFLIGGGVTSYPTRPELLIPLVLAWASVGIYVELGNPKERIVNRFDSNTITMVQNEALIVCIVILAKTTLSAIQACRNGSSRNSEDEEGGYRTMSEG